MSIVYNRKLKVILKSDEKGEIHIELRERDKVFLRCVAIQIFNKAINFPVLIDCSLLSG